MIAKRTFATTLRVWQQLANDPRSLVMILFMPSVLLGMFAWLFDGHNGADGTSLFNRFGPPMLALFPFMLMFLICSITTLRERRSFTLQRLLTTPMAKGSFVGGYALAFGTLAILQSLITVWLSIWFFGLKLNGSPWILLLVAIFTGIAGMALGLFTSAFATTEFQAIQFMPIMVFPQAIVCGLFMPRDEMPGFFEGLSYCFPLTYAVSAVQAVVADDMGWNLWRNLAIVLAWACGFIILAITTLRRRTD